ncbi:MAG: B12-binding domain-containing radical SAM protein [Candidatus Methanodesulfokora sp.]
MFLILDALAAGKARRLSSLDVIGAGPRLIAGILEDLNFDYKLMRVEDFLRRGKKFRGTALISAMTMDEPAVARATRLIEGVKIAGGPITSDISVVRRLNLDLGVWGEGEVSLKSILLRMDDVPDQSKLTDVPNLIFKSGTTRFRYLSREEFLMFRPSVNAIKFYNTIPHYKCSRVYVEVVRSCSNFKRPKLLTSEDICRSCNEERIVCPQGIPPGCGYCSIPHLYGPPKSRDESSLLEEIEGLAEVGVKRIVLSGADFLEYGRDLLKYPLTDPVYPGPNLDAIESLLSKVSSLSVKYGFHFEVENVKPCLVDERVARLLGKYLKNTTIHIGVETGDEKHSELIGRPCGPEKSISAVKLLKEAGLRPYVYFIHSLPGQSRTSALKTVEAMKSVYKIGAEKITVYKFRPLPGTAFGSFDVKVDSYSRKISKYAIRLNRKRKELLVGRIVEAVVAPGLRGIYAYPLRSGPTIKLRDRGLRTGDVVRVRITGVLSDRLVEGSVIKNN